MSGLLHTADENDWSDLGLEREPDDSSNGGSTGSLNRDKRSSSKSPIVDAINEEDSGGEDQPEGGSNGKAPIERWTSSNSLTSSSAGTSQPSAAAARRKSSEMSSTMKIRLEAFEERQKMESQSEEARKMEQLELVEHEEQFRSKLKNFQKISSRSELMEGGNNVNASEEKKPPPPLSYSKLIEVLPYFKLESLKLRARPHFLMVIIYIKTTISSALKREIIVGCLTFFTVTVS